jgi:hypothetical protein
LSHIIRKHTTATPAAGASGEATRFKKPKTREPSLDKVREAAMKPFEMPNRVKGSVAQAAKAKHTTKIKPERRRVKASDGSQSSIDSSSESEYGPSRRRPGGKTAAEALVKTLNALSAATLARKARSSPDDLTSDSEDIDLATLALRQQQRGSHPSIDAVGSVHSMNLGKMHQSASLHLKRSPRAKITRERDTSATTGTSNVTAADSVSTASDDKESYPDVMAPIRKAQGRDSGKLNKSADGSRTSHPAPAYRSMTSPPSTTPLFGAPKKSYGAHHRTLGDLLGEGQGGDDDASELSTPSERDDLNDDYDEESQDEL